MDTWNRVTEDFRQFALVNAKSWSNVARQLLQNKVGTYWGNLGSSFRFVGKISCEKGVKHLQLTHSVCTTLESCKGWQLAREEWVLDAISGLVVRKTAQWWTDTESLSGKERSWTPDTIVRSQFLSEKKAWNSPPAGQLGFWGPIDEPPKIGSIWEQMQSLPVIEPVIEVEPWGSPDYSDLAKKLLDDRKKSEAVCFIHSDLLHLAVLTYRKDGRLVRFFEPRCLPGRTREEEAGYGIFYQTIWQSLKTKMWSKDDLSLLKMRQGSLKAAYDQQDLDLLLFDWSEVTELPVEDCMQGDELCILL